MQINHDEHACSCSFKLKMHACMHASSMLIYNTIALHAFMQYSAFVEGSLAYFVSFRFSFVINEELFNYRSVGSLGYILQPIYSHYPFIKEFSGVVSDCVKYFLGFFGPKRFVTLLKLKLLRRRYYEKPENDDFSSETVYLKMQNQKMKYQREHLDPMALYKALPIKLNSLQIY